MVEGNIPPKVYREFLVQPKAARREALALLGVIVLIVLLMGLRFSLIGSRDSRLQMRSYQMSNLNLKNQSPTIYRALLGAMGDVVDIRNDVGHWPNVATLADEALPPFADAFLPAGLRGYVWQRFTGEGWVDYFGINKAAAFEKKQGGDPLENSFILRIIDLQSNEHPHPHPGKDNNPSMRFSSQVWINSQMTEYPGASLVERGWKWIVPENGVGEGAENVISERAGE